jgi:hypothetical protein
MKQSVIINKYFPKTIATRKAISVLKNEIDLIKGNVYEFDFSNITFISRSFADEFLKFIKSAEIDWVLKKMNSNVKAIIEAVRNTQESPHSAYDHIAITRFKNEAELNHFLTTF